MKLSTQETQEVLRIWRDGGCIGLPTETVYGLAADATNDKAVAGIYALKERPSFNPLICHVDSADMAKTVIQWNAICDLLLKSFWPGALTVVRPKSVACLVSDLCAAGGDCLAVRMPQHPHAQALISAYGRPIAAPSANKSGRISPTTAQHVRDEFGDGLHVVDGGACQTGVESTILWVEEDSVSILRPGSITQSALESVGVAVRGADSAATPATPAAPGQLSSHYAPHLPVRLNVAEPSIGEAFLGFGEAKSPFNLSPSGDVVEAAANLFAYLRMLDDPQYSAIAVAPIPDEGVGVAINDRLQRAAAPRG